LLAAGTGVTAGAAPAGTSCAFSFVADLLNARGMLLLRGREGPTIVTLAAAATCTGIALGGGTVGTPVLA
jgi:hypothetical protein